MVYGHCCRLWQLNRHTPVFWLGRSASRQQAIRASNARLHIQGALGLSQALLAGAPVRGAFTPYDVRFGSLADIRLQRVYRQINSHICSRLDSHWINCSPTFATLSVAFASGYGSQDSQSNQPKFDRQSRLLSAFASISPANALGRRGKATKGEGRATTGDGGLPAFLSAVSRPKSPQRLLMRNLKSAGGLKIERGSTIWALL